MRRIHSHEAPLSFLEAIVCVLVLRYCARDWKREFPRMVVVGVWGWGAGEGGGTGGGWCAAHKYLTKGCAAQPVGFTSARSEFSPGWHPDLHGTFPGFPVCMHAASVSRSRVDDWQCMQADRQTGKEGKAGRHSNRDTACRCANNWCEQIPQLHQPHRLSQDLARPHPSDPTPVTSPQWPDTTPVTPPQ